VNSYLINLARRSIGDISGVIEPPARLTFLPGDTPSGRSPEQSYRYPAAFEASTVGRGRSPEARVSALAEREGHTQSFAPKHRLAPPLQNSVREQLIHFDGVDEGQSLPVEVTITQSKPDASDTLEPAIRPAPLQVRASSDEPTPPTSQAAEPEGDVPRVFPESYRGRTEPHSSAAEPPLSADRKQSASPSDRPSTGSWGTPSAEDAAAESSPPAPARAEPQPVVAPRPLKDSSDRAGERSSRAPGSPPVVQEEHETAMSSEADVFMPAAPPAEAPAQQPRAGRDSAPSSSVEVHIGTIELRASEPKGREQSASTPDRSPPPKGFDEYRAQRQYKT
jgi:hypothetical protein